MRYYVEVTAVEAEMMERLEGAKVFLGASGHASHPRLRAGPEDEAWMLLVSARRRDQIELADRFANQDATEAAAEEEIANELWRHS